MVYPLGQGRAWLAALFLTFSLPVLAKNDLALNDKDYFEKPGLNVLVFSNWYDGLFSDSKTSGVELIHHGERTVTNGDVRLNATPEQWDMTPLFKERKVNHADQSIEAFLHYPDQQFDFSIKVTKNAAGVRLTVNLPKPLPKSLEGKAGFNLEFLPAAYFHKSFLMDDTAGGFPVYPTGLKEINGKADPIALAQGQHLVFAPEDVERRVSIQSTSAPLELYDGRGKAQNGWFVVRSKIPANKTGTVIEWQIDAATVKNWIRKPMIAHSQVGYHPAQKKVAVIELDARDKKIQKANLVKINADGTRQTVLSGKPKRWGKYLRYEYHHFDFSSIQAPGLYAITYGDQETHSFRIDKKVYQAAWHPTLDMYLPVQMDHVTVNESYRIWHGASHLDDALQAPVNHEHFDLYAQGPTTDTQFKPGEHIPGLNIGGWYDAGDYDIRTQTQYDVVNTLVTAWETFGPTNDKFGLRRDTTSVDYARKFVDLHTADGKPDILQQIEHGTLALIAQHRAVGHAIPGIVEAHIDQYHHLGDGVTKTDNLIYDPEMGELETNGFKSGKFDDRWAFTSKSSSLNYGSAAALAAASRALKGFNDELAQECLVTAKKVWSEEQAKAKPDLFKFGNTTGGKLEHEQLKAATELLITTGEAKYAQAVERLLSEVEFAFNASWFIRAAPAMNDAFRSALRTKALAYREQLNEVESKNPFAVPITEGGWAGSGAVIRYALNNYYIHKAFPDVVSRESVLQGLNFLYGTHPAHNLSLVSNVGTRSKEVAYGMNRADFSFISGGIVPGILILKPDYPENHEDWPFFWGQNEYVVNLAASYIFLVNAAEELLSE
ncbi:glycoside hydrolase [Cellvibrio mixtus]|uniref:Glycoside hydrolase n=1 Tax=Cellvibrio mixtus TaxID=39650 RepID=A0A266Q6W1_9GAMM|nr:glycoside hydrolase family 9 protein [Cellvibrio mixtus]OZY85069.1 glycoside hydrolase [Cellvibrio mixtus]